MARASAADGIGTTTIGFGEGFSEDLLASMADAGGGGAYFAPTPDAAPGIFAQELEDLLSLEARNVSAEIRPAWGEVALLQVLNDFPQVPVAGGVQVQLGDAYGEELRRVVFQLRIPRLATLGPAKVAEVIVRYVALGQQAAMHELSVPVVVNAVSTTEAATALPDAEVTEEVVILLGARAQDEARELADAGRYVDASSKLRDAADQLRKVAQGSAREEELHAEAEKLEQRSNLFDDGLCDRLSRKQMTFENRARKERRLACRGASAAGWWVVSAGASLGAGAKSADIRSPLSRLAA